MRLTRQACPHRVRKQVQAMAGVSCTALLLGHLSAHCRAASAAPLDRNVSKVAGFAVKAVCKRAVFPVEINPAASRAAASSAVPAAVRGRWSGC